MAKQHCLACGSFYEESDERRHDTPCSLCRYDDHPACCCAKTAIELDREKGGGKK